MGLILNKNKIEDNVILKTLEIIKLARQKGR